MAPPAVAIGTPLLMLHLVNFRNIQAILQLLFLCFRPDAVGTTRSEG